MAPQLLHPTNPSADDAALLDHINSLGLSTVGEYLDWSQAHGFGRHVHKHWRLRLREREFAQRARADAVLLRTKRQSRQGLSIVRQLFRGDLELSDVERNPQLAALWPLYLEVKNAPADAKALLELFEHVFRVGKLWSAKPIIAVLGQRRGNSYVDALFAVFEHRGHWIRPIQAWRPRTTNRRRQFASLVRHLFARWHVPSFMDSLWFNSTSPADKNRQKWFIRLGQGENVRSLGLPLPYTRRMAHYFMQAPAHLSVEQALRWGQLRAMGAGRRLIRAVNACWLATEFDAEHEFWEMVFRWLIRHQELTSEDIDAVIRYAHLFRGQQGFTLKGRTVQSLFRQMDEWNCRKASESLDLLTWPSSGIASFDYVDETPTARRWTIRELLDAPSLGAEGRMMQHCVASYGDVCSSRISSIWSMEVQEPTRIRKMLTIEVTLPDRVIYQVKGKCNTEPGKTPREILRRWAEAAGLTIDSDV